MTINDLYVHDARVLRRPYMFLSILWVTLFLSAPLLRAGEVSPAEVYEDQGTGEVDEDIIIMDEEETNDDEGVDESSSA